MSIIDKSYIEKYQLPLLIEALEEYTSNQNGKTPVWPVVVAPKYKTCSLPIAGGFHKPIIKVKLK